MFLDSTELLKKHNLLLEAEDDEDNDPSDEPTESDAEMDLNDEVNEEEGSDDESDEDGMDGEEEEEEEGDNSNDSDISSDDSSSDDSENASGSVEDNMKKRRLFKDYRDLIVVMEECINSLTFINYQNMTDNEKKIFNYIEDKLKEDYEKVSIIIKEQFTIIEYKKLLELYVYFKLSLKNFTEILKNFIN